MIYRLALTVFFLTSFLPLHAGDLRIVVSKTKRTLEVHEDKKKLHTFRTGLGFSPIGAKTKLGDGKTPEGIYSICVKNSHSKYYLSLGINYPSVGDAAKGLRDGLITKAQHDKITSAIQKKQTPPWDTALGGEIYIHGRGSTGVTESGGSGTFFARTLTIDCSLAWHAVAP